MAICWWHWEEILYIHCSGLLGDSDRCSGKMVLKRPFLSNTGKDSFPHIHSLAVRDAKHWAILQGYRTSSHSPWETGLWVNMIFSKRPFVSDTDEALALHVQCSGLWEIAFWSVFQGGRALSWNDIFSGKMVLKRLSVGDTGGTLSFNILFSGVLGGWALRHSPKRQSFELIQ